MASIQKKVDSYAKSKEGKKRIDDRIEELLHSGDGRTASGGHVTTISDMSTAARIMEEEFRTEAQTANLPDSVMYHINAGHVNKSDPKKAGNRYYTVDLTMEEGHRYRLFRPSLEIASGADKGQRTGDGIDNIVALFNNGYAADGRVFGYWKFHEDLGVIGSRTSRKGLQFMQDAVRNFNRKYGAVYNVTATLDDVYESGFSIGGDE